MKRAAIAVMMLVLVTSMTACVNNKEAKKAEDNGSSRESITIEASSVESTSIESVSVETSSEISTENTTNQERITDDQALEAIKNYCLLNNPDLEEMLNSDEQTIYWDVESSDENQIVVLYRSYTAALVRYYIDPTTGETYVTEFVPDITEEEERTDESFNLKDYIVSK